MTLLRRLSNPLPDVQEAPERQSLIRRRVGLQPGANSASAPLPDDFLVTPIETQDVIPDRSRVGVRHGYTHVSTLVGACARREVIANLHTDEHVRRVTSADRVVWALGRAAERHVRKQLLASRNNQGVYGRWVCTCEQHSHVGMVPAQDACPHCNSPRNRFLEHPVYDEEAWIVGNCDIPVMHGEYLVVTEIKSIKRDGSDGFEGLEAAKANHILQALIYRDLYRRAGWKTHNYVKILYVCKDYPKRGIRSIYKEFSVDATTPASTLMVDVARAEALVIRDGLINKTIPPRTLCSSPSSPAARDCPMLTLCWNL